MASEEEEKKTSTIASFFFSFAHPPSFSLSLSLHPNLQTLAELPAMVQGVWSADPAVQLEATTQFRKLLSIGEDFDFFFFFDRLSIKTPLAANLETPLGPAPSPSPSSSQKLTPSPSLL